MIRKILIFALLLTQYDTVFSQKYFFKNYSVEQGLPQSSLFCLLQDSRGFMWIGTDGAGVTRFDGNSFETFSKTNGLSDNVVRSLLEDSKGNIWIGTGNGITVYDGYSFRKIGKEEGLTGTSVLKLVETSGHNILAATNDGGLAVLTPGDSLIITNLTTEQGLTSDFIFDVFEDKDRMIWIAMVGGINILELDDSLKHVRKVYEPEVDFQSVVSFLSIEPGKDGNIWLGSYGNGLFNSEFSNDKENIIIRPWPGNDVVPDMMIWDMKLRKNGDLWLATDKNGVVTCRDNEVLSVYNTQSGLQSNQILNMTEDSEGNMWFASFGQGAMVYSGEKIISYGEQDGIKGLQVLDILFTRDEIFYAATEEGILKFRKKGTVIELLDYFSEDKGLNAPGASSIEAMADGQIWIGTTNGINILKGSVMSQFPGNRSLGNKNVNCLISTKNKDTWIGTIGGYGRVFGDNLFFMDQEDGLINDEIQTIIEDSRGNIWLGTLGGIVRIEGSTYTDFNAEDGLSTLKVNTLAETPSGNILIGTDGGGIFQFDTAKDSVPIAPFAVRGALGSSTITSLLFANDTVLIAGNDAGFDLIITDTNLGIKKVIHNSLNDGFTGGGNNPNSIALDHDGMIWFGTKSGIVRYDPSMDLNNRTTPQPFLSGIRLFYEDVNWKERNLNTRKFTNIPENLVLSHKDNHLTFLFTALSYLNPEEVEYSYFLENQSKEWSPYTRERDMLYPGLTPGNYTFRVKARNKYGQTGDIADYNFVIKPPFWQTAWFLVPAFILFIALIIIIVYLRERNLIKEKIKLERIVDERTREVVEQKDEIAKQRDVVMYQKKEITDSIQYAERIQKAVLPVDNILKHNVADYFILFRPKDIVSGDFYWMAEKSGHIIFTAADCTGHGVPGAFMSMLGVSFLNKIVNEECIVQPSEILNRLRKEIIVSLKQEGTFDTNKDGMDIALCTMDLKNMTLQFAGANNPIAIIRKENGEYVVNHVKGDKMPIGFHSRMDDFTNHVLEIRKGDTIYLTSDGYEDQFGGPDGKKFMKARLTRMLTENQHLKMSEQKELYSKTLDEWISQPSANWVPAGQIDDVILLGVRI